MGKIGKGGQSYLLPVIGSVSRGDVTKSMRMILNNAVLYT